MMPSNSTAKIQARRDLERRGDGGRVMVPKVQAYAQSEIRYKTQFCAQTGLLYKNLLCRPSGRIITK